MVLRKTSNSLLLALALTVVVSEVQFNNSQEVDMTKNQLEFEKLKETKRSNQKNENLTQSRDENTAIYQRATIALGEATLSETKRSNLSRENETNRANVAQERQAYLNYVENQRHNLAYENENARSHRASESIQLQNLGYSYAQLEETSRANRARELEQHRANVASETEAYRSHKANESMQMISLEETERSHKANEAIASQNAYTNYLNYLEAQRAHLVSESFNETSLAQQRELKERELEDRYFWQDKANAVIDLFTGGITNEKGQTIPEAIQDAHIGLSQWINDAFNRAETRLRTGTLPLKGFEKEPETHYSSAGKLSGGGGSGF